MVWEKPDVQDFVRVLEKVTGTKTTVWPGYDLGDATIIVDAGQTPGGEHCLGVWKNGKALSYTRMQNTLQMLTPLYSYYLRYQGMGSLPEIPYFTTAKNAPAFEDWMQHLKVSSAVYLPVDFSKLPFTVPALVKVQLGIHEAFHVEVMLKYWYTKKGQWPAWDQQPDRKEVQQCYTYNDTGRVMIREELRILADMVEALLDNKRALACSLGTKYLAARENRYEKLQDVQIKHGEDNTGDCRTAEALFELEEGLADYASWTLLFNIGIANRDQLLKRYRAFQQDHFYLSGSMLMHAITLMSKKPPVKIMHHIIQSSSVHDGSLLKLFGDQFADYCERR